MSIPLASRFFTFYSFKGGVGRSMALLNCGYVLAGYGRRVLMIDFDLEAPGLSFLIQRREGKKKSRRAGKAKPSLAHQFEKGLVELIGEFAQDPEGWPLAQAENAERLEDYITNLSIPSSVRAPRTKGQLALLPAGRIDEQYESRLANIDWGHEPLASHRDDLFRHLRNLLVSLDAFDYVLIDSRTGWSDEGYISARILADHLIVLTALNDQNIIGTSRFLKQVEGWPQPENSTKRRVVLVESPVPEWEEQAKADRHAEVQKLFQRETGDAVNFSLSLPYNPRIALREEALVADWPDTSLSAAYRHLTAMIQDLAADTAMHWWQRAREAMSPSAIAPEAQAATPKLDAVRAALESLRPVDSGLFGFAADSISDQLIRSSTPIPGDVALMRYFVRCLPDNPSYILKTAMILAARHQFDAARRELDKAEEVAIRHGNHSDQLLVSMQRATIAQDANELRSARDAYTHALNIAREQGDQPAIALALYKLGVLDRFQGGYKEARRENEESLKINRALDNRQGIAATLNSLAVLDFLQGDYQKARRGIEESLKIKRALGDQREIAVTLHSLAELDRLQGAYQRARRGFEKSAEIFGALGDRRGIAVTLIFGETSAILSGESRSISQLVEHVADAAKIGDPHLTVRGHLLVAEAMTKLGDAQSAQEMLNESIEMSEKHGLNGLKAEAQSQLALLLGDTEDSSSAARAAKDAIRFFDAQDVRHPQRETLERLADTARSTSKHS